MYKCNECGAVFEEPKMFVQRHGLETPPYETWTGCPYCQGDYECASICARCGEWFIDESQTGLCEKCENEIEGENDNE